MYAQPFVSTGRYDTLKEFLASSGQAVARWESTDPGLDLDLDEPADYERALALRTEQLAVGTR